MKNFTFGLNIALFAAVAVLFYWHFSNKPQNKTVIASSANAGNFRVAYFEMDTVQNQFEYLKEVRNGLLAKDQSLGKQLSIMQNEFTKKYQELQSRGASMSQAELAAKQQELVEMDKNLKTKKQAMEQEMADESTRKLQDVKKKIEDYLKTYNKDKGYAYILSSSSDLFYYKDSVYNITNDLVKGLNDLYKKK
ncbi:MAG: OmpH family outer membrane protein [Bacteroidetes bacterium]|nr:OmpH family outer membrane protein [Bacteroidota bacterium]MBS1643111.1 OmpH family outer membrane protein [Bacteroidota bacterium]MBS1671840.1 OmpH family outer membrane protein [Bacteroidota bacterium]